MQGKASEAHGKSKPSWGEGIKAFQLSGNGHQWNAKGDGHFPCVAAFEHQLTQYEVYGDCMLND